MISREQGALRNSSWKLPLNASTSAWAIRAHMLFPVSGGRSVLIGGRPCQLVFVSDRYGFWATKLERSHRKWCPDLCRDSFFCGCQDATSFYKRRYRNRAPASILRYGLVAANLRIAHSNSFDVIMVERFYIGAHAGWRWGTENATELPPGSASSPLGQLSLSVT
jgi:hypothetical protein